MELGFGGVVLVVVLVEVVMVVGGGGGCGDDWRWWGVRGREEMMLGWLEWRIWWRGW